jgi:hypothetical protein
VTDKKPTKADVTHEALELLAKAIVEISTNQPGVAAQTAEEAQALLAS